MKRILLIVTLLVAAMQISAGVRRGNVSTVSRQLMSNCCMPKPIPAVPT